MDQLLAVEGNSVSFTVIVEGAGQIQYEWHTQDNGPLLIDSMPTKYVLSNEDATLTINNVGSFDVRTDYFVRVSNGGNDID